MLAIAAFLLLAILVLQASFNLKFISPDSNQELLFFVGLSGLIFFAFVALTLVLGRNLLKLYAERRQGVAGSKFRTRLVVVSLLLSFLPVIAMFWFSYGLMNRSIDKWFSQPVEEVRADTAAMVSLLYDYAGQNATTEAQSIAESEEFKRAFATGDFYEANEELREHIPTLQGGFALALAYSGWYNGLAKKHYMDVRKGKEAEHEVIVYCKAHPELKIIQAMDVVFKGMRERLGIEVKQ